MQSLAKSKIKSSDGNQPKQRRQDNQIYVVDLCSGMGGLSCAAAELGMEVLAGVDINKSAIKTYAKNFPLAVAIEGSVKSRKIIKQCQNLVSAIQKDGGKLCIVSGPPCQGFSAAGSRNPKDQRNQVLVSVAKAIAQLQPQCAIIENVSMVLADKYEARVSRFKSILTDAGYYIVRVLLDASEYGLAQRRKRTFFIATQFEVSEEMVLSSLQAHKTTTKSTSEVLAGLPPAEIRPDSYSDEADYGEVHNHFAMQHSLRVQAKIASIPPGKGPMSYRKLHPDLPSNTLFSGHRAPPAHFSEPRSITVREAARLQGFPDSFRVYGSFGNQMEQVTNAVPPPLARAVLQSVLDICHNSIVYP